MHVIMYVRTNARKHVRMYACTHVYTHLGTQVRTDACARITDAQFCTFDLLTPFMQEKCEIYEALKAGSIVIKNRISLLAKQMKDDLERAKRVATLREIKMLEFKLKNIKVNKYILVYHGKERVYCETRSSYQQKSKILVSLA